MGVKGLTNFTYSRTTLNYFQVSTTHPALSFNMVTNVQLEQKLNALVESVGLLTTSVQSSKIELSGKIDGISARLDGYDEKFKEIERSIQSTDNHVGELQAQVGNTNDQNRKTFEELNKRIADLEEKL